MAMRLFLDEAACGEVEAAKPVSARGVALENRLQRRDLAQAE